MKQLVIIAHFDPNSFTLAVAEEVKKIFTSRKDEIKTIDLYAENFNPVFTLQDVQSIYMGGPKPKEVEKYQGLISWADHLTFIHPCWWTGFPSIMKGFFDRVFTAGFAIKLNEKGKLEGLLSSKKATIITLTSFPSEYYEATGMTNALILTSDEGIFKVCCIESKHIFCGSTMAPLPEGRKAFLENLKEQL